MKRIWAPWRMKFVENHEKGCVFCKVKSQTRDEENLIIFRGQKAFVILNRYPYTSGHLLVVANAHRPSFEDLEPGTRAEMMELATKATRVLRQVYQPEAFNIGANIGKAAGAGIEGHVHLHVVPRWAGDSNFMMTLAETKVMPEALEETYRRVRAGWRKV